MAAGRRYVCTGDLVVGDGSGLIMIPKEEAIEAANRALEIRGHEAGVCGDIRRGSILSKINEVSK